MIKNITVEANIQLSPQELAQEFYNMSANNQAMVLNHIAAILHEQHESLSHFTKTIVNSKGFLNGANKIMKSFGEHAK